MKAGGLRTHGIKKTSSNERPLITIVTVVYNGEKTLEQTILSVLNQSYENLEYIIIDGLSTDGTLDIIKKYEDKIDYWQSEPDKGIYDAMNKGIEYANGSIINMMNSGDILFPDILEKIAYSHRFNPNAVLYGLHEKTINKTFAGCGPAALFPLAMPCHQTVFIPTNLHKKYGLYDINFKIAADFKLLHVLYKNKVQFIFLHNLIAFYDDTGISSNYLKRQKEFVKAKKELGDDIKPFTYEFICLKYFIKKLLRILS